MKRKSPKSKRPTKSKRSAKSSSKRHDPFVFGELLVLDKGKVDMTPRPTTIKNFKELIRRELGDPPPLRKKKK
jgi:hypothetical protein